MEQETEWDNIPIEKQTSALFVKTIRMLWGLVQSERKNLTYAILASIGMQMLVLGSPISFKYLLDYLAQHGTNIALTTTLAFIAIALVGVRYCQLVFRWYVVEPLGVIPIIRLENQWPILAQEKLLGLSAAFHAKENTGKKAAKVAKAIDKLVGILVDTIFTMIPAALYIVLNLLVLAFLDWRLALILIAALPVAGYINLMAYRKLYPIWDAWESLKERASGLFVQSLINLPTVQSFGQERYETQRLAAVRDDMRKMDTDGTLLMRRYHFMVGLALELSFSICLVIGLILLGFDSIGVGTLVYVFVTGNATNNMLRDLIQSYSRILKDSVAAERLYTLFQEDAYIVSGPASVQDVQVHTVTVDHVSFGYGRTDGVATICGMSLDIPRGSMVALVGKSGSGKSTLVKLLSRVYDPSAGKILINGKDITEYNLQEYRKLFATVEQEVLVFEGSILENVRYAFPEASEELVWEALKVAHLDTTIADQRMFPKGIETEIGERGVKLSGGQRQRVGIARAYVALKLGAQILILDEATSSLDSEAEAHIHGFIQEMRKDGSVTIVTIAHRLSTVRESDTIYVLDRGQLVQQGSHDFLVSSGGIYADLVRLQELS